jgi:hypothetical protein
MALGCELGSSDGGGGMVALIIPSGVYWTSAPDGVPTTTCLPFADQQADQSELAVVL